jgi:Zn-dependent metalloprotease
MKKIFLFVGIFLGTIYLAVAQQLRNAQPNETGSIMYADLQIANNTNPNVIFHHLLQISTNHSFVFLHSFKDNAGYSHDSYQQYYKGVKVEGGIYTLHSKGMMYEHISGNFESITNLSVAPTFTETEALQKTMTSIGATQYAWQNAQAEKFIKALRKDDKASYLPKGELLITKNWELFEKTGQTKYHLCYAFYIRAIDPDLDLRVFMDTQTGEIIAKQNMVCHINGTANTLYNGNNVPIKTSLLPNSTNEYILYDEENNISTLNAGGSTLPSGAEYSNYGNNFWSAAKPEHDAHFGATKTVEYWKNTHNRQSYNGQPNTVLTQLVNAPSSGTHDNATWTQAQQVIRYGNGEIIFKPLTSLDVVAHEIGHAYSHGLNFNSASNTGTQALHEGLSDIWAMCIDRDNWTLGEQIMKEQGVTCFRSIENPTLSTSKNKGATTYRSSIYNALDMPNINNSPHGRGLVLAHWFYMLCEGKVGVNENGNSYAMQAIGKENAEKIVYGMYPYLDANGWLGVANAALQSAKNLYGECSIQYAAVYNALYAANLLIIGGYANIQIPVPTINYTFSKNILCHNETATASINYTFNNTPSATLSYEWTIADEGRGLHFTDANGANLGTTSFQASVTLKFLDNGTGDIHPNNYATITVYTYCNTSNPTDRKMVASKVFNIWLGKPNVIKVLQPNFSSLCVGQIYGVQVQGGEGRTQTLWTNESPAVLEKVSEEYNTAFYKVIDYGVAKISVTANNQCGNSTTAFFNAPVWYSCPPEEIPCPPKMLCPLRFSLSPNPASSIVKIENLDKKSSYNTNFTFKIYNSIGILIHSSETTDKQATMLDVSTWADGLYMVVIQTHNNTQALKLAVQKGSIAN